MASALVTVADGAAAAVAVGGAAQPSGLNVTAGNTLTFALSDISGVTGWAIRSVANSLGLNDQAWSQTNVAINQAAGTATAVMPTSYEYGWFVFQSEIINATLTPAIRQAFFGVYVSAQGSYRLAFPTTGQTLTAMIQMMQGAAVSAASDPNLALVQNQQTVNGQGVGGPTICALLSLTAKYSGIFDYSVAAAQPAAAGGEVVTFTLTSQTGTGALAYTGQSLAGVGGQVSSAAAGTGIAVSTGGGGELVLAAPAQTIGTAAVGITFSQAGILHNSNAATVLTPFARGQNVLLLLKITNSVTSRQVSSINMRLSERLFA